MASIEIASLLHDVGKLGVPDQILLKPGALSLPERKQAEAHVGIGTGLVAKLQVPDEVCTIVGQHHERCDGSGYPLGLRTPGTHVGARILAVSDVFEALTSDRPYRKALPMGEALGIVGKANVSHLDPVVVNALLRCTFTLVQNRFPG